VRLCSNAKCGKNLGQRDKPLRERIKRAELFKNLADKEQISELRNALSDEIRELQKRTPTPDDEVKRPIEELQSENAWIQAIKIILKKL
jgi:hypothetical protein